MPEQFIPERWLQHSESIGAFNKAAFRVFSAGDRQCLGKKYLPNN